MQWSEAPQKDNDVVAQWPDGGGHVSLRKLLSGEENRSTPTNGTKSTEQTKLRLIHEMGDASAIWAIGTETLCKIHDKEPAVCSEATIINFVREKLPSIPVPKVFYYHDEHKDCTAFFLQRVQGETLRDAWVNFTDEQKNGMLDKVTEYCTLMAGLTSDRFMGVGGESVLEPYLYAIRDTPLPPLTVNEVQSLYNRFIPDETMELITIDGVQEQRGPPEIKEFHFYHADLGPGNIMMRDGEISAIIDWESGGYYPKFWIATKPGVSPGLDFYPAIDGVESGEWRKRLREQRLSVDGELVVRSEKGDQKLVQGIQ